jgi:DNA-binding response OmpR family regulator
VLLVEPDPELREALLELLREHDHLCTAAASVDLDPTVIESVQPRLIILAPAELDPARALLRHLERSPACPPVVLLLSLTIHAVLSTHPCVVGSLRKPIDPKTFLEAVEKYSSPA